MKKSKTRTAAAAAAAAKKKKKKNQTQTIEILLDQQKSAYGIDPKDCRAAEQQLPDQGEDLMMRQNY
jgi:hypothetical protein